MLDQTSLFLAALLWGMGWIGGRWGGYEAPAVLIRPPLIVRLFCGFPQSKRLPRGVMMPKYVIYQLGGLGMFVYALIGKQLLPSLNVGSRVLVGLGVVGCCIVLGSLLIKYLNLWPYSPEQGTK
jgi:hypothetical protein